MPRERLHSIAERIFIYNIFSGGCEFAFDFFLEKLADTLPKSWHITASCQRVKQKKHPGYLRRSLFFFHLWGQWSGLSSLFCWSVGHGLASHRPLVTLWYLGPGGFPFRRSNAGGVPADGRKWNGGVLCVRLFERYMKHSYQSAGGFKATYLNVGIIRYYKWLL